jgi:hypothetical protein
MSFKVPRVTEFLVSSGKNSGFERLDQNIAVDPFVLYDLIDDVIEIAHHLTIPLLLCLTPAAFSFRLRVTDGTGA